MTKVVYICHPFRGDVAANRERVRRICAAVKRDYVPLAPHILLPAYIDEATERHLALDMASRSCADRTRCGSAPMA